MYQKIIADNGSLSRDQIEHIRSQMGDFADGMSLKQIEAVTGRLGELQNFKDWRSFLLEFGLLRSYKAPNGYGNYNAFIDTISARTIPEHLLGTGIPDRIFTPAQRQEFLRTQEPIARSLWLKPPVYWLDRKLCNALNDTNHPGNVPEFILPLPSFILALPQGYLLDPTGCSVNYILVAAAQVDGASGVFIVAYTDSQHYDEYFYAVPFQTWADRDRISIKATDAEDIPAQIEGDFFFKLNSLVAKTILYFNTIPDRELKVEPVKIRRIKKHPLCHVPTDLWSPNIIGESIDWQQHDLSGEATNRKQRSHVVRGHFHSFWTGKGRTELKVNWIMPYWKGVRS